MKMKKVPQSSTSLQPFKIIIAGDKGKVDKWSLGFTTIIFSSGQLVFKPKALKYN